MGRIVILIGLCLITRAWVTSGEEENVSVNNNNVITDDELQLTTPSTTENVTDLGTNSEPVQEQIIDSEIDRSSHFHHLVHTGDLHHHHSDEAAYHGFWKKKLVWRPRWVKTWQEKKVYVAVWKRMWGPAMINEWVPIPKPPPGWFKPNIASYAVKTHPYRA